MNTENDQMTIFDFLGQDNPNEPIKMPEWEEYKYLVRKCKGLDEIEHLLPKYLVTFKKPVFGMPFPYKKKICSYIGYWHSIDGWSYRDKDLLNIESWEPVEYRKGDQYSFSELGHPYRFQCNRNCDVEYCSLICFERRGAMFDRVERKFARNENGELLYCGSRSCDVGVEGMNYIKERSST